MENMKIYTTDEIVEILHISRRTLYNYIKAGEIKAFKAGREWRITNESLKEFTERGTSEDYLKKLKE